MPLLYSKDSRAFLAKSKHAFANVLAQNAQAGDFIYIGVDGETDFLAIAAAFSQRQTQLRTVTSVLD
jgi:cellobiose-specific phosphotransferase system component IIC